jgi:glucose-6-phosphate isomerase
MKVVSHQMPVLPPATVAATFDRLLADKSIGFTDIPSRLHLREQSVAAIAQLKKEFSQFVVIGIGGSSMGPRALVEMSFVKNILFLDNVDSVEFERVWSEISQNLQFKSSEEALSKTAFIVISKSGSTLEILWNYSALENRLTKFGLNINAQSFFITEPVENDLSKLARQHNRPCLEIPVDVGGRFSVLTPVGLVIAGLCGYSPEDLHKGAQLAVHDKKAVTEATSLFLDSFKRKECITLFWFYNSNYRWFGHWLQQLWSESLGKLHDRNGQPAPGFSSPFIAIGSCDQHSIFQQIAHSTDKNKFVCFYNFKSVENSPQQITNIKFNGLDYMEGRTYGELISSQSIATEQALRENKVSTARFTIDDANTSFTLGYLFMYFQLVVATIGEHENINPFDQPGVALGKELTLQRLKS